MTSTKRYDATPINMDNASYEVRLENGTITISNINSINPGTLYAKKGSTAVKIEGISHDLDVSGDITSVEDAATAIKSILYVLNNVSGSTLNEAIIDAVSIDGTPAGDLTFADLEQVN